MDPLQIFKSKGTGNKPYISEKSIIRPTFSYLGNFTISDAVFRQIAEHIANKTPAIYRVTKTRINNGDEGVEVYMEVVIVYGYNVLDSLREFKTKCKKEIEKLTAMNVGTVDVVAKGVQIIEENNN